MQYYVTANYSNNNNITNRHNVYTIQITTESSYVTKCLPSQTSLAKLVCVSLFIACSTSLTLSVTLQ